MQAAILKLDFGALCRAIRMVAAIAALGVGASSSGSHAAAVKDQILARALYFKSSACQVLKIEFNSPTRYVSHYPYDRGNEVRIALDTLSHNADDTKFEKRRESLRPPNESDEALASITYEGNTVPRPVLTLAFRQIVAFKIAQGDDFRSLIVAIAQPHGSGACEPIFPATE